MTGEQGYVVLVWSFPLGNVPSHRIYGSWPTRDEAFDEAAAINDKHRDLSVAVLPLRAAETLKGESP